MPLYVGSGGLVGPLGSVIWPSLRGGRVRRDDGRRVSAAGPCPIFGCCGTATRSVAGDGFTGFGTSRVRGFGGIYGGGSANMASSTGVGSGARRVPSGVVSCVSILLLGCRSWANSVGRFVPVFVGFGRLRFWATRGLSRLVGSVRARLRVCPLRVAVAAVDAQAAVRVRERARLLLGVPQVLT